jgi:hypothetical protein
MNHTLLKLRFGCTIDQKKVAVHGTFCAIPRRNNNHYDEIKDDGMDESRVGK